MRRALLIPALLLLAACKPLQVQPGPGEAVCACCAYNRDMACVIVPITKDTVRTEYKGRTVYFCSEHCKAEFLKDPEKYEKAGVCGN